MTDNRLELIEESSTLRITNRANELKAQGKDVISFSLGEPDFTTPAHICEAATQSIGRGETHYTPNAGIPELREAIAKKFQNDNNLDVASSSIIVTPGAKQAVFETILSTVTEGDEVITFDPSWVSYHPCVQLAGAKTVWAKTIPGKFTPDDVSQYVTKKTKLIIVNSPGNPSGAVFDKKDLQEIADIAIDHDITVMSDEIYEKIIYDKKHLSIGSFDGMAERTVTVNGFSKAYAMTGWRLGYVTAPPQILKRMLKLQSHSTSGVSEFVQRGGVAALTGPQQPLLEMIDEFRARRDLLVDGLNEIGMTCKKPDGAFYAFADVSAYGDGDVVADKMLKEAYVATTPGSAFGASSRDYIRISYATSRERIREALKRIEQVL